MALLKRKPQKGFKKNPSQLSAGGFGGGFGNDGGSAPGDYDPWQGMFSTMHFDSLIKHFIEPGDDLCKLAMRSVFGLREPPDLLEVAACYARYERFHQTRHLERLRFIMAGAPSIGGASRAELLQGGSKILAETAIQQAMAIRTGTMPELMKKNGKKPKGMHYPEDEHPEE